MQPEHWAPRLLQLSEEEFASLKSQIVTSSWGGIRRGAPHAFTEQGVAMLSSVLHSDRAIHVNSEIMRAFVRLPQTIFAIPGAWIASPGAGC